MEEITYRRVYKFFAAEHALDNLERGRVKIATVDDLNDPFDLFAVDTTHPAIEQARETLVKELRNKKGLLCFSKHWDNILMWSHYASSHTGICFGFDIHDHVSHGDYGMDVAYQANLLPTPRRDEINFDFAQRLLLTKYEMWAYEQEVRVSVQLNDPSDKDGRYWFEFGAELEIKEIIVGAQSSVETIEKLRPAHVKYSSQVDLSFAHMRNDAFSLVRKGSSPWFPSK